jgi:DNA transformation protein and related proteins
VFFGILFHGRPYFRADEATRADYLRRGMELFRPGANQTLKNYYEVPAEILEDAETLVRRAVRAASARADTPRPQ